MRTIQKTISLEPMTSRLPSIWPSYKDNVLYFFDDKSLKEREQQYPCNYGMIPMFARYSADTEDGVSAKINNNDKRPEVSGEYSMSWNVISDFYYFFKEYYRLINKCGSHGKTYTSATEYYDFEINYKYSNGLEYGTNRDTYEEMDEKFNSIGGDKLYTWITTYIVPTYSISSAYTDYWKTETLSYPEVIKWIAWFNIRKNYETDANFTPSTNDDIEHWDCKGSGVTDCCDCDEYFKRGGNRELSAMTEWYNTVQSNIITSLTDVYVDGKISHAAISGAIRPDMIDIIELQNSLDNIGQYTDISPQYKEGIDYRTGRQGEPANIHGGTTVIDASGNTMILKEGSQGFCFSPFYMEKVFDEKGWDNYTVRYISGSPEEFVASSYTYYAFDDENRIYSGTNSGDVISTMASGDTYQLDKIDSILVNDMLIPIENTEYGIKYDEFNPSGKTYFVRREKDTSTPYTVINGKKIYAESYISTSGLCYYFSFFKAESGDSKYCECGVETKAFDINDYKVFGYKADTTDVINFIYYNSKIYEVPEACSGITIIEDVEAECPRVSGYTYDKYGEIIYASNERLYDDKMFELPSSYTISNDVVNVNVYNRNTEIYRSNIITGKTISKLPSLMTNNKLVDDIGKEIDGIYVPSGTSAIYAQPPIGTVLEPLYQVGNTSLIGKFKLTKSKESDIGDTLDATNYFVGNIIDKMVFYYNDVNGNMVVSAESTNSSLDAITNVTNEMSAKTDEVFDESLYCDIEYYIGATLERKKGKPFKLAEGNYNHGVKYKETVKFVKKQVFYGLKPKRKDVLPKEQYETENLSSEYPIFIYEMVQDTSPITNYIYNTIYDVALADFEAEINLIDRTLVPSYTKFDDMEDYNNINVSPTFKQEYKLGTSIKENVDADIYIDRGVNAAFERHLKLGEVTSLEALLNYGNGFFKIMEN